MALVKVDEIPAEEEPASPYYQELKDFLDKDYRMAKTTLYQGEKEVNTRMLAFGYWITRRRFPIKLVSRGTDIYLERIDPPHDPAK
jgi:hypothetical protein